MPPESSSSSSLPGRGRAGPLGGAFLAALGSGFLAAAPAPGSTAAKRVAHLGHLTFLPSGSGLAGRNTVAHLGQVNFVTGMTLRPAELPWPSGPRGEARPSILPHHPGFRQTLMT